MADETSRLVIAVDSTSAKAASADLDTLTAASAKAEAATTSLGQATNAFGETQADVDARIRAVAQAYREELEAGSKVAQSTSSIAAAKATESVSTTRLVQAQNAQMAGSSRMVAAQAQYERILGTTSGTEIELSAAEAKLNTLRADGAINATEYAAAVDRLAKAKLVDAAASKVGAKAEGEILTARQTREIGTVVTETLSGNTGRLKTSAGALANSFGLVGKLLSPVGLAITGVAVAVGGTVAAMIAGERETAKYNQALAATGTAGVTTAGQLRDVATALGESSNHYSDARAIVLGLAQAGDASSAMFQQAARAASDYAIATGVDTAKAVSTVTALLSGNFNEISKVDQAYQFLTSSQLAHIRALADQGRATDAAREAMQLFESKSAEAKDNAVSDAGYIVKAWDGITGAIGGAVTALKGWGAQQSLADQKKALIATRDQISKPQYTGAGNYIPVNDQAVANVNTQIDAINKQLVEQGFAQTQAAIKTNAEKNAKAASDYLSQFLTPQRIFTDSMEKAFHARQTALLAPSLTASDKAEIESQYGQAVTTAQQALQNALKKNAPKASKGSKADPLASLQTMVDSLGQSALRAEGPVGEFLATVSKLSDARDKAIAKNAPATKAEELFAQGVSIANQRLKEQETQLQQRNKEAMDQFTASILRQEAAQRALDDLSIASVGMGSQQAERQQQILQISLQTQQKIFDLQQRAQQSIAQINPQAPGAQSQIDTINKTLTQQEAAYQAYGDWQIAEAKRVAAGQDAAQHDWSNGLKSTYANLLVSSQDFASMAGKELNDFASGVSDAFVNVVQGGESVKKAFGSVIDTMLADALRFVANEAFTKFIGLFMPNGQSQSSSGLGALLGSSGSSGGTSGSGGTDWGSLIGDVASWFGGGKAGGGPVESGRMYEVNEQGPELLTVGGKTMLMMGAQNGTVTPAATTSRHGGNTNNITVLVQPTTTRRTADQTAIKTSRALQLAASRA